MAKSGFSSVESPFSDRHLDKHQRYQLSYIGVGHMQTQLIVDYRAQQNLTMDITLDRAPYLAKSDKVQLKLFSLKNGPKKSESKGDSKTLSYTSQTIAMTQIDQHHFQATVPLEAGQLKYQLSGVTNQKLAIENPQASQFEYHRNGHFFTLADHQGGDWTLDLYLPNDELFTAHHPITLSGEWGLQITAIQLQSQFNRMLYQQNALRAVNKAPKFVFHKGIAHLQKWREQYPRKDLQQLIGVMSTTLWGQGIEVYQQAIEKVPPKGWYWSIPRATFAHSLYKSGKTGDGRDYNTVLLAQHQTYRR
jgi:hypothetical protein